ncbi:MAG TPA: hypothetical protein VHY35_08730 [Stellaceae bacterium]|nr:hypothetical protein [Stellaceae bacterium]
MSLAEAGEIFGYWEANPPPHLMLQAIARLIGWVPQPASGGASPIGDIAATPPPGMVVQRDVDFGMPAPLDAAALRGRNRARAVERAKRDRR